MANLDLDIQQLNQQRDGLKVYKQIQKLTKKATASSARLPVVQALLDYAEKGSSVPHRSIALSDAVSIEEFRDLPCGWAAERISPKHKWKRLKHHPFPSFDEDGYYLDDVVELAKHRDDLSPPSKRRRENCKVGASVKLLFRFGKEDAPRKDN